MSMPANTCPHNDRKRFIFSLRLVGEMNSFVKLHSNFGKKNMIFNGYEKKSQGKPGKE
jgi:hypothetical protein